MSRWREGVGRDVVRVLAVGVVALAAAFAGNRLAGADPGGRTRDALSVSGTIRGVSGTPSLRFVFHKDGSTDCTGNVAERDVQYDASNGHFSAAISISEGVCRGFFDGANVSVSVFVNDREIVHQRNVNAVPYAKYADQVGVQNDCPAGYTRDTSAMGITLCVRRRADGTVYDEMVKVGMGASAFWIDRYEASVWEQSDGSGTRYDGTSPPYPDGFARNGQWSLRLYATSTNGVRPAAALTWFQANAACHLSGKSLPRNVEWMWAATGTPDPGASGGENGLCATGFRAGIDPAGPRSTGQGTNCRSTWGAQDMIGNLWEVSEEWMASAGNGASSPGDFTIGPVTRWPIGYGNDITFNVNSHVYVGGAGVNGIPAVIGHGGSRANLEDGGLYAWSLTASPSEPSGELGGFRCVIRR